MTAYDFELNKQKYFILNILILFNIIIGRGIPKLYKNILQTFL